MPKYKPRLRKGKEWTSLKQAKTQQIASWLHIHKPSHARKLKRQNQRFELKNRSTATILRTKQSKANFTRGCNGVPIGLRHINCTLTSPAPNTHNHTIQNENKEADSPSRPAWRWVKLQPKRSRRDRKQTPPRGG